MSALRAPSHPPLWASGKMMRGVPYKYCSSVLVGIVSGPVTGLESHAPPVLVASRGQLAAAPSFANAPMGLRGSSTGALRHPRCWLPICRFGPQGSSGRNTSSRCRRVSRLRPPPYAVFGCQGRYPKEFLLVVSYPNIDCFTNCVNANSELCQCKFDGRLALTEFLGVYSGDCWGLLVLYGAS
jgi:hypothetical protein